MFPHETVIILNILYINYIYNNLNHIRGGALYKVCIHEHVSEYIPDYFYFNSSNYWWEILKKHFVIVYSSHLCIIREKFELSKSKMMRLVVDHWIWYSNHRDSFEFFSGEIKSKRRQWKPNESFSYQMKRLNWKISYIAFLDSPPPTMKYIKNLSKCFTFTRLECVKDGNLLWNNLR